MSLTISCRSIFDRLLFDDIPFLEAAQSEHDEFASTLRFCGAEVVYLTDLVSESLTDPDVRSSFIHEFIAEAGIRGDRRTEIIYEHLAGLENSVMLSRMISGVRKSDIPEYARKESD